MSNKPCKLPKPVNKRSVKKDLTLDIVAKTIDNYYSKLKTLSGGVSTEAQLQAMDLGKSLQNSLAGLVDATISRGTKHEFFNAWMSQTLGWRKGLLSEAFGTTGEVQERLLRMTEGVNGVLGNYVQTQTVEVYKMLETIKSYGISSLKDAQVILHDAAIVSSGSRIITQNSGSEVVARFIQDRTLQFTDRLISDYGLTNEQVNVILNLGDNYQRVYDDAFTFLRNAGLPIKQLEGYVPVTFDGDFTRLIQEKYNNLDALLGDLGNDASKPLTARMSYTDFIVSDVATATHMLSGLKTSLGREIYTTDILRWSTDATAFKREVIENLSNNAVQQLMDSGAVAKIPSMYSTLVEQFVYKEGVPLGLAQDVLVSNPVQALTEYTLKLKTQLKESMVVQDLLSNGIDKGWLLDKATIDSTGLVDDFINIGNDARLTELISSYVNAPNVVNASKQLYVHKSVAQAMAAIVDFNTNPALLGTMGKVVEIVGKFNAYLGKSMLANPVSAIAQVTQNAVQMYAATGYGGIFRLPTALYEVGEVLFKGLDKIDNTRVVIEVGGESLTKRQLLERLLNTRASNPFNQVGTGSLALNPERLLLSLKNTDYSAIVRKAQWNAKELPVSEKVLKVLGLPGDVVNAAFKPIALSNYLSDTAARYATIMTIADNGYRSGTKRFNNVEELLQHADEYFGLFDGSSTVSSSVGRYVMPFFSYMMNYPGQVVRHAWRYPRRFHNVYRFYSAYKQQADRDDLSYYDKASWQKERLMIEVATDPITGQKVAITPGSVSSEISFLEMIENGIDTSARLFGLGTTNDRVADLQAKIDPAKTIGDFFANSLEGTYLSNAYEVLTNKNPWSGEAQVIEEQYKRATILGVPVSPLTRRVLLFAAPSLNSLDRSLPEAITGRRAVKNAAGVDTVPGQPGWMGVIPEQGGSIGNRDINSNLGALGLRATQIDTVKNLVGNYNELNTIITDSNRVVKSLTASGRGDSQEARNALEVALIADLYKREIDARASELGVPAPTVFNEARQLRMKPINELLRPMLPRTR